MAFVHHSKKSHKLRVAILMGGPSHEHDVSLSSARNVMQALKDRYALQTILIGKGGEWPFPYEDIKQNADVAFIAMHGTYGEDGTVQSILQNIGMPYTGSNALSSAIAMNKFLSLRFLGDVGIRVPRSILITRSDWRADPKKITNTIHQYLHYPIIIKPNALGSSVGIEIVANPNDLNHHILKSFEHARDLIAQSYIDGREFTCGVLDHGTEESTYPLLPTEIIPRRSRFFDYAEKYSHDGALEVTPPNIPENWIRELRRTALLAHKSLGCRGMSRTDMILGSDGVLYVLEVNTIPGLTDKSLLPKGAAAIGIDFPELLDRIINASFLSFLHKK